MTSRAFQYIFKSFSKVVMRVLVTLTSLLVVSAQGPTISSPSGQIQGTIESCGLFCSYFSFKGIPYAQPPIGNLRFRNPVPHPGWSGVRNGSQHGAVCPQLERISVNVTTSNIAGDEDCLFLNVYSQELIEKRPVMLFIHGGAFTFGSGNVDPYDPQKLVREGVVVVTINYRLGALGFLSTGDEHAQGNWGLKDCIEALRWVQRNIAAFGGNPNEVTIFGDSAGSSMVHFLYLSDMAQGLFHKAIAESGTAIVPFAFQPNPKFYANRIAASFDLSSDSAIYVDQLRALPASSFVPFQGDLYTIPIPRFLRPMSFSPSVEPASSPEPRALTDRPLNLMQNCSHNVPLILGHNDLEGAFFTTMEFAVDQTVHGKINNDPHLLVPYYWNIPAGSSESTAVSSTFQRTYFQDQPVSLALDFQWAQYYGDHLFLFPVRYTAEVHARGSAPVYYYQFGYDGDLNVYKKMLGITHPGAVHSDELPYLFEMTWMLREAVSAGSHARMVSDRMVRMWTNFAKYGDPTPIVDPLLQNVVWSTVQEGADGITRLDIGENLVMTDVSASGRLQLWRNLQDHYARNPFL